jgi:hypothetical protein
MFPPQPSRDVLHAAAIGTVLVLAVLAVGVMVSARLRDSPSQGTRSTQAAAHGGVVVEVPHRPGQADRVVAGEGRRRPTPVHAPAQAVTPTGTRDGGGQRQRAGRRTAHGHHQGNASSPAAAPPDRSPLGQAVATSPSSSTNAGSPAAGAPQSPGIGVAGVPASGSGSAARRIALDVTDVRIVDGRIAARFGLQDDGKSAAAIPDHVDLNVPLADLTQIAAPSGSSGSEAVGSLRIHVDLTGDASQDAANAQTRLRIQIRVDPTVTVTVPTVVPASAGGALSNAVDVLLPLKAAPAAGAGTQAPAHTVTTPTTPAPVTQPPGNGSVEVQLPISQASTASSAVSVPQPPGSPNPDPAAAALTLHIGVDVPKPAAPSAPPAATGPPITLPAPAPATTTPPAAVTPPKATTPPSAPPQSGVGTPAAR